MSRIARAPVFIYNVKVEIKKNFLNIKGPNGNFNYIFSNKVGIEKLNNKLIIRPMETTRKNWALAGTIRALINSMVIGVTEGFIKKLKIVGLGYRALVKGKIVSLYIGFSHVINHELPPGIIAECPIATEIVLKSANKHLLGQVASDIRSYRIPEPYKGKGIRYVDEVVIIKETKKK